jgi:hypothetical protein
VVELIAEVDVPVELGLGRWTHLTGVRRRQLGHAYCEGEVELPKFLGREPKLVGIGALGHEPLYFTAGVSVVIGDLRLLGFPSA